MTTYKGYTQAELKSAFDKIADPSDWKNPISAEMAGEEVTMAMAAIEFFTATTAEVAIDTTATRYTLTSPGYRIGPAGP